MKKTSRKGQISMEYMILVAFIMAMIIPLYLLYHTQYEGTNEQIRGNQADQISRRVVDAAESVYYLGEPSKTIIKVYMPKDVDAIMIGSGAVVFQIKTRQGMHQVVRESPVEVNGSINEAYGIKQITVESKGDYVQITSN